MTLLWMRRNLTPSSRMQKQIGHASEIRHAEQSTKKLRTVAGDVMYQRRNVKYYSVHKNYAHESQRCRINESGNRRHEEHFAELGHNSMSLCNLVHLPIPIPKAMNISAGIAALDKEWETRKNLPGWQEYKVRHKQNVIEEAQRGSKTVLFASLMDSCHLNNFRIGQ